MDLFPPFLISRLGDIRFGLLRQLHPILTDLVQELHELPPFLLERDPLVDLSQDHIDHYGQDPFEQKKKRGGDSYQNDIQDQKIDQNDKYQQAETAADHHREQNDQCGPEDQGDNEYVFDQVGKERFNYALDITIPDRLNWMVDQLDDIQNVL